LACKNECKKEILVNIFNNKLNFTDDEIEEAIYYLLLCDYISIIIQLIISAGYVIKQKHYSMICNSPYYKNVLNEINIDNMIIDNDIFDKIISLIQKSFKCGELIDKFMKSYKNNENVVAICCYEYAADDKKFTKFMKKYNAKLTEKCLMQIIKSNNTLKTGIIKFFETQGVKLNLEITIEYLRNYVNNTETKKLLTLA
jgi:hypothetical protein